jgi:hypothetical protein
MGSQDARVSNQEKWVSKCRNVLTLASSLEAHKFLRAALRASREIPNMTQFFPQIRRVAAAITISPRMAAVPAAAWHSQ